MDVFISHSWRDKTTADLLADDIRPMCDHLWLDASQFNPAIQGQTLISQLVDKSNLLLVIWSSQAANTQNNRLLLDVCLAQDKMPIICRYDNTALPGSMHELQQFDMRDYMQGFTQLCQYLQEKPGTAIAAIIEALTRVQIFTNRLQKRDTTEVDYIQHVLARWHEADDNREIIQSLLFEVTLHSEKDTEVYQRLRDMLERDLNRRPLTKSAIDTASGKNMPFELTPEIFLHTLTTLEQEKTEISLGLRGHIDAMRLPEATAEMHYYILSSVDLLGLLHDIALSSESPREVIIVKFLYRYVQMPHASLAAANDGAWGLIDDAWLIQNTAYRLIEAGIFARELFPFDWERIAKTDAIVIRCLPTTLRHQLEALLMQFMHLIALEVKDYQPHFCHDDNRYHPYMGQAQALGLHMQQLTCESFIHL